MKKIYFPNLNGIRFIAAFMVIIHHMEQIKRGIGLDNFVNNDFVTIVGKLGVILFFVLSGFLITYLLLSEEKYQGNVSIRQFYIRRILRIWPLYFFVTFMAFLVLPKISFLSFGYDYSDGFLVNLSLYVLMLPNFALAMGAIVPFVSQAWSVGTEEQFYLIWPILMKRIKNKKNLMIFVILFYIIVKAFLRIAKMLYIDSTVIKTMCAFWDHFNVDCMAIGGLMAVFLFYNKTRMLNFLYNRVVQILNLIIIIVFISFGVSVPFFHYQFYAILFSILILNIASNPSNILNLENRIFNYLGKISYGMYMYHGVLAVIAIKALLIFNIENYVTQLIAVNVLTIVFSSLSYEVFEKRFLLLKRRHSKILSGDFAN